MVEVDLPRGLYGARQIGMMAGPDASRNARHKPPVFLAAEHGMGSARNSVPELYRAVFASVSATHWGDYLFRCRPQRHSRNHKDSTEQTDSNKHDQNVPAPPVWTSVGLETECISFFF
jgi:hypothetical protein